MNFEKGLKEAVESAKLLTGNHPDKGWAKEIAKKTEEEKKIVSKNMNDFDALVYEFAALVSDYLSGAEDNTDFYLYRGCGISFAQIVKKHPFKNVYMYGNLHVEKGGNVIVTIKKIRSDNNDNKIALPDVKLNMSYDDGCLPCSPFKAIIRNLSQKQKDKLIDLMNNQLEVADFYGNDSVSEYYEEQLAVFS
jgi:hypothetical protein